MKAIQTGNHFKIYDDSLRTFDQLPAMTYNIRFSPLTGFSLEGHSDLEVKEKTYGVHLEKVKKVFDSFSVFERSLGVILSGKKGIGKSLFARILCEQAVERGLPVIIVDQFIPGIASFIESIEQEVIILFDEFDKTFGDVRSGENEADPQASLLSLFDGVASGKKLFVITCNNLYHLNDYLINRPGRFHYHFQFNYPSPNEIREYLQDKIAEKYYGEIDRVIEFSRKVDLNYDCLRAIAFELNTGASFKSAIQDLNIVNTQGLRYNVVLHFVGGATMTSRNCRLDLFGSETEAIEFDDGQGNFIVSAEFDVATCLYNGELAQNVVHAADLKLSYDKDYDEEAIKRAKSLNPDYMVISRVVDKDIHFKTA